MSAKWQDVTARGSGAFGLRLEIEGWPAEWVTDLRITHASNADGRSVYAGLLFDGLQLRERVVLRECWPDADGMTFKIRPSTSREETLGQFTVEPEPIAMLGDDVAVGDTTIVLDTGGLLTTGQNYHIATECFECTDGATNTIARGKWGSLAQTHHLADESYPKPTPIYTHPPTMEGRRVWLHAYGLQDDLAGDGTLIWRGIVSRPPRMDGDGLAWSIHANNIVKVFEQNIAAKEIVLRARGIYHSSEAGFVIRLRLAGVEYRETLFGFWEDDAAFVAAVNTALLDIWDTQAGYTGVEHITYAVVFGVPRVSFTTNGTISDMQIIEIGSILDGLIIGAQSHLYDASGTWRGTLTAPTGGSFPADSYLWSDTSAYGYAFDYVAAPHRAPWGLPLPASRQMFGTAGYYASGAVYGYRDTSQATTYPPTRIYVTGALLSSLSSGDLVVLQRDGGQDMTLKLTADPNLTDGWIEASSLDALVGAALPQMFLTGETELRPSRDFTNSAGGAAVSAFMDRITSLAHLANDGDTPYITSGDVASDWATKLLARGLFTGAELARNFIFMTPLSVKDIVQNELKALGFFAHANATGQVTIDPLPRLASGEAADWTITDADMLAPADGRGSWPSWEAQSDGIVNQLTLRMRYDYIAGAFDDAHDKTIRVLSSIAEHRMRGRGEETISRYSQPLDPHEYTQAELVDLFTPYLSVVSRDYVAVTIEVPFAFFGVLLGDVVAVSGSKIPDGAGSRGVTSKRAMVVGRDWPLDPRRSSSGKLTLYFARVSSGGYTPAARVTSQTNISGNTWDLTCDDANAWNIRYSETGDGIVSEHFAVDDAVRIVKLSNGDQVLGTVVSASGEVIRVTFAAAWSPGGDTWDLVWQIDTGSNLTAHQEAFTWIADATRKLTDGSFAERFL